MKYILKWYLNRKKKECLVYLTLKRTISIDLKQSHVKELIAYNEVHKRKKNDFELMFVKNNLL
jgi:hypothetical protein